jgi:osmotically inducible protein OsmC
MESDGGLSPEGAVNLLGVSRRYHEVGLVRAVPCTPNPRTLHPVTHMPTRIASAVWTGGLKGGTGTFKGETGIGGAYTFVSRFEQGPGSNPEELLAAAEASCYSMALSGALEKNGTVATKIETSAACTVEKVADKQTVTKMAITVKASVPGIDSATFQRLAEETRTGCPISRALNPSIHVTLKAELV